MKQLTVCIDDGLQGEVVYRAEISHTEEDYQELKSDLEFVREENKKLKEDDKSLESAIGDVVRENRRLKAEKNKLYIDYENLSNCNVDLIQENKKLREELSAYDREYFDEDKKAKNIFIDKSGKVIKGGEFTTLCKSDLF